MKILVVDDDVSMLALLEIMLEELGHETALACGGEDALRQLEGQHEFQLVLTDLRMPGIDGLRLLQWVHDQGLGIPCAVMSVLNDMSMVIRSLRLNAIDYLPKPIEQGDLCDLIKRVEAMSPAVSDLAPLPCREQSYRVELPSERAWVPELCRRVVSDYLGDQPGEVREAVRLALHEALMNAVIHGNFSISSDAKRDGRWHDFEAEVQASEEQPALNELPIEMELTRRPESVTLRVTDVGQGFDPGALPDPGGDEALAFCGRGITLIRHLMDEVSWSDDGRRIEMSKQLRKH